MDVSAILLTNLTVIAALLTAVWLVSLRLSDVSIVDLVWGLGFVVVAWVTFYLTRPHSATGDFVLPVLTTVWGLRLSAYLAWRNHGQPEDKRYRAMRAKFGDRFPLLSLLIVFGLQGLVMWIVALPLQLGQSGPTNPALGWLGWCGVGVWLCGLLFESVGDWQLARFKADPANRGQVFDRGLWRYTRHPNYFGDFLVWWGLFAVAVGRGAPVWTAVGPAVMSLFLMKVSGVTLLEQDLKQSKPGYAEYIRNTSAFFPRPPRN
jgi:steroid 5-alpha reductase family enzyme